MATSSFRDIIGLWPTPDALALELGAKAETVRKWRQRDSIPADWWHPLIKLAKARGHTLNANDMAAWAAQARVEAE